MKKKLLISKRLMQFFFSLCLTFVCANVGWSQSIFYDSFGTTAVNPYTGAPAGTYTKGSNGVISTVVASGNSYLNFNSDGIAAGKPNLTAPFAGLSSSFNTTLTNNTNLVTWTVNMRASKSMSSNAQTYADNHYYLAVVLCASNATLAGGTGSGTDGYALILQRSTEVNSNNPNSVRLVRFHNGIGASASGSQVSLPLIETPSLNGGATPTQTIPNNVSIKVTYNPDYDAWQLYYREDPTTAPLTFADPLAGGAYTRAGNAVIDATYTSTAMTHFGFLASEGGTTTGATSQMQIDNFNINLNPLPIFTPSPTVNKKQAFNNTPAPTVASLVANGTDLKWYAAATGGSPLLDTDPITNGATYYVTQTLSATESDRVSTSVFVGDTSLRTLPFYENFNYTIGEKLVTINNDTFTGTGLGGWSVVPQTTAQSPDDMIIAAQPGTWTSSVLPTPTGNALTFDKSGLDPQILFDAPTSGSVYASCMFTVTNLNSITNGTSGSSSDTPSAPAQFFSLAYAPSGAGVTSSYTAAVYLKSSATAGKFNIGINAAPSDPILAGDIIWDSNDYTINTPITLVVRYSYDDLTSKLWINPTTTTEPTATATTSPRATAIAVDRVRLNQAANATTPFITIDEIRAANNWGEAVGAASTLGLSKAEIVGLQVYPNPVSNGALYINSANDSEKQITIFNVLGQKKLETTTSSSEAINVSSLSKGFYFLQITEDGKTETKKLIVE